MNTEKQPVLSAPYTIRNGRKYIAKGIPSALRERLEALEKSIALTLENASTYTGDSFLDDVAEAEAIRKALAEAKV